MHSVLLSGIEGVAMAQLRRDQGTRNLFVRGGTLRAEAWLSRMDSRDIGMRTFFERSMDVLMEFSGSISAEFLAIILRGKNSTS